MAYFTVKTLFAERHGRLTLCRFSHQVAHEIERDIIGVTVLVRGQRLSAHVKGLYEVGSHDYHEFRLVFLEGSASEKHTQDRYVAEKGEFCNVFGHFLA